MQISEVSNGNPTDIVQDPETSNRNPVIYAVQSSEVSNGNPVDIVQAAYATTA